MDKINRRPNIHREKNYWRYDIKNKIVGGGGGGLMKGPAGDSKEKQIWVLVACRSRLYASLGQKRIRKK